MGETQIERTSSTCVVTKGKRVDLQGLRQGVMYNSQLHPTYQCLLIISLGFGPHLRAVLPAKVGVLLADIHWTHVPVSVCFGCPSVLAPCLVSRRIPHVQSLQLTLNCRRHDLLTERSLLIQRVVCSS
eukprot:462365-Amphidinium_carterae.2